MMQPEIQGARGGFDTAIHLRAEDKLDRWKFAREIYGVAVTGPPEWSVRIGIYGEWGTGKSSVLNMIRTMAETDNHLVVSLNPWAYSDALHLWHGFVQAIERQLFPAEAESKTPWWKRWKRPAAPISDWLSKHGGVIKASADNSRVTVAVAAIEILKSYVFSKRTDLEKALKQLGNRRLIVLVDDLDRAQATMVPEILFAFKELLDVGGLAFMCAFDPVVVGKALKRHHEGFEDGLKFLEKVMDYPRWLPDPSIADLIALARTGVAKHCDYVPTDSLEHAITLLPRNPRAVRQFVRLLALLKDQVARHYDYELDWPTILAANVLKIRYPRYAPALLGSESFWREISTIALMHDDTEEEKRKEAIEKHLAASLPDGAAGFSGEDRKSIEKAITQLATQVSPWTGRDEKSLSYQMNVAEAPAAVTRKEFEEFLEAWGSEGKGDVADKRISEHALRTGRQYDDVYRELFYAAVHARQSALGKAADSIANADANPELQKANDLMDVLRCLAIDLGNLDQEEKRLKEQDLKQCFEAMMYYAGWPANEALRSMRQRERALLLDMAELWERDLSAWLNVLKPFSVSMGHEFRCKEAKALYDELIAIIMPKFARLVLEGFGTQEFIHSVYAGSVSQAFQIRCVLLDVQGPLWKGLRSDCLAVLRKGASDSAIQENSYVMFYWCNYLLRKEAGLGEASKMTELMKDDEIRSTLWAAATSQPLSVHATASIRELPGALANLGITLDLPDWWEPLLTEGGLPSAANENATSTASDNAQGETT